MIGEPQAFIRSIESTQNLRNTGLRERLQSDQNKFTVEQQRVSDKKIINQEAQEEAIPEKIRNFILTPEMVESFSVDAMIGMDEVKP